ncbi:hypothetical protein Poli38472_011724 [Pythium oligandrum]|uniref:STAS domain-containing protein n=1 Tax=Pythium oligandrum TaxID=41045 RepID=A0A8K1C839_PYTOL|nr:hypothetical protein Poli38472_011724 [Pythium oligandrum]|eukprot:TMW58136.1 hypothetical protein Poli38472_011724 [Pythium oligandrum]
MTDAAAPARANGGDDELSVKSCLSYLHSQVQYARQHTTKSRVLFFLKQHIPILEWLPTYDIREDLQYDLVAGITVGMMIVPQEISLGTMMGVPPIYGLYTAALVPMIYPLFGTSRVLSVANGSEVSLLVGSAIRKVESEEERVATGILLSFLVGLILLLMGIFRLGIIADFFSRPVMGGFISAGGVLIILSQFANWLGVHVKNHDLPFLTVLGLLEQSPHINMTSFFVGAVSIAILMLMRMLKRSVVREIDRLEVELDEEFEIETSRAMSSMSSVGDLVSDDEQDDASEKPSQYDDIELGELPTSDGTTSKASGIFSKKTALSMKEEASSSAVPMDEIRPKSTVGRWLGRPSTRAFAGTPNLASMSRPSPQMAPALYSTGSLRRGDYLTSPWSSTSRGAGALNDADARASRQGDLSQVIRSTRNRASNVIKDEGVGFSLSDEDYLNLEQPLEYSMRRTPGLRRGASDAMMTTPRARMSTPRVRMDVQTSQKEGEASDNATGPADKPVQPYARVKNMASPAKSETASITDSTNSTTALNGRTLESIVSNSTSIRILRSKIAVLVALRLVCDLGSFMVCLLGGIVGYMLGEDALKLTGKVPGGYPAPILPWYGFLKSIIETDRLYHIVIDTLSIAIISYMSSIAMAKRLAIKEGYRIRPNQELIALGLSNLVGSFFQSMPATGGLSRTAVNMQNARTQLASLITVGIVVIALYTATSALAYLPKASLAAIIIVAGHSLIETKEAKWLYRVKRDEFYVWLASFILTCVLGVLPGLLSSIFCSLIAVIYKTRRPMLTMLGEVADEETGEKRLVDLDLYPDTAHPLSDIVVIRVEGALYFANCEYVERVVEREIQKREQTEGVHVHGVIIDACSIMDWDSTTIQMMKHLNEDLHVRGIQLSIVNARDRLQSLLESTEFLFGIVLNDARIGFDEAIKAIREAAVPPLNLDVDNTTAEPLPQTRARRATSLQT